MDTSQEYIKMCEKASDIQSHKYNKGDFLYCTEILYDFHFLGFQINSGGEEFNDYEDFQIGYHVYMGFDFRYDESHPAFPKDKIVWLPRQDQLQDMIECDWEIEKFETKNNGMRYFGAFDASNSFENESVERLLLMMVMHNKFSKTWDGENWISTK